MTYLTNNRFGKDREYTMTKTYYRSRTPLSGISQVDLDAGGRTTSNIKFIHVSMSSPIVRGQAYVSFHKIKGKCIDALFANQGSEESLIVIAEENLLYRIPADVILDFRLPNPHLYEMDVHFLLDNDSLVPSTLPQVSVFALFDNGNWNEVGTQGQLKALPYVPEGVYYSKKNVSPYMIGKAEGSVMNLGNESGISVLDGQVSVTSRQYETFLGLQFWVKSDAYYDNVDMELSVGDGITKFFISQYDDGGVSARFSVGETTLDTGFTLFQGGQQVSVPTLRNGVWTAIGVAFDSPVQPGTEVPKFTFGPGVKLKNIIFYGGDNLAKIMNFRSWAQVAYSNNTSMAWQDWDDKTWAELYISASDVPAMDIGKQYRGTIGTNRYVVGEDEGEESHTLYIIDDGITITSKAIVLDSGENLVLSTPSWKGVGTYSA